MNSTQFEVFCKYFLAQSIAEVETSDIRTGKIPGLNLPDKPEIKSQIDLFWYSSDDLREYFNIVNAKWRSGTSNKVDQGDVLLLDRVKQLVCAHKAFMISNADFYCRCKKSCEELRHCTTQSDTKL